MLEVKFEELLERHWVDSNGCSSREDFFFFKFQPNESQIQTRINRKIFSKYGKNEDFGENQSNIIKNRNFEF